MPLQFQELLKKARKASRYPAQIDFAKAVHLSSGGYAKIERGDRMPSAETLERILNYEFFPEDTSKEIMKAWRKEKASRAGIPTPPGNVDIDKVLSRMERELVVVLRQQASELSEAHVRIARTFKKKAEIILRTALET
jgi:transcriptional regulator with XRE-family HTH domain